LAQASALKKLQEYFPLLIALRKRALHPALDDIAMSSVMFIQAFNWGLAILFGVFGLGLVALLLLCICGPCGTRSPQQKSALLTSDNSLSVRVLSLDSATVLDTACKRRLYSCWQMCARCYPALFTVGVTFAVIWLGYWDAQRAFLILTIWYVYLGIHTVRVAIFGWVSMRRMREHTQTDWKAKFLNGESSNDSDEDSEERANPGDWDEVLHLVFMPNYKEEIEILQEALDALACTPDAQRRIGICFAMEEREEGSREKVSKLTAAYVSRFRFIDATYHPSDLPGERPGKCSNMAWSFPHMRSQLKSHCPDVPESMVMTTVIDADSELHPRYFDFLTYAFLTKDVEERYLRLWLPAVMHFKNYRRQTWLIRIMSVFCSMNELACIADPLPPNGTLVTYSTYSLSLDLWVSTGGVDPNWIAEDWHCTIKAVLKTSGAARCEPVYMPVCNYTPEGETACQSIYLRWDQAKRHMLGVTEIVYILWSIWLAFLELPTLRERCRFCCGVFPVFWKCCHVHATAAYGWLPFIGMLLGLIYQFSAYCDMAQHPAPNPLIDALDGNASKPYCPFSALTVEHLGFGASESSILYGGIWLQLGGVFGLVSFLAGLAIDTLMVRYYDEFGGSSYPGAERGSGGISAQQEGDIGGCKHFLLLVSAMCVAALPSSILFGYIPEWIAVLSVAWQGVHFTHNRTVKKIILEDEDAAGNVEA
jgi:hypothetical protein